MIEGWNAAHRTLIAGRYTATERIKRYDDRIGELLLEIADARNDKEKQEKRLAEIDEAIVILDYTPVPGYDIYGSKLPE